MNQERINILNQKPSNQFSFGNNCCTLNKTVCKILQHFILCSRQNFPSFTHPVLEWMVWKPYPGTTARSYPGTANIKLLEYGNKNKSKTKTVSKISIHCICSGCFWCQKNKWKITRKYMFWVINIFSTELKQMSQYQSWNPAETQHKQSKITLKQELNDYPASQYVGIVSQYKPA